MCWPSVPVMTASWAPGSKAMILSPRSLSCSPSQRKGSRSRPSAISAAISGGKMGAAISAVVSVLTGMGQLSWSSRARTPRTGIDSQAGRLAAS